MKGLFFTFARQELAIFISGMGVTVAMPGRLFKTNNTVSYNIFPVWVVGKWSRYTMFQSNKKRSNFSSDSATLGISESKKVLVLPLTH